MVLVVMHFQSNVPGIPGNRLQTVLLLSLFFVNHVRFPHPDLGDIDNVFTEFDTNHCCIFRSW